jgi:hypothetical protein
MARSGFKGFVGVLIAGSMFVSSTGAVAATSSASLPQINPWAALAIMSGAAPVAALCNGATPVDPNVPPPPGSVPGCILPATDLGVAPPPQTAGPPPPIPVPPVEPAGVGLGLGIDPLLLGLGAVLAGVGLYFLLKKKSNNANSPA